MKFVSARTCALLLLLVGYSPGAAIAQRAFALVIGISKYPPTSGVQPLAFADSDAVAFAQFLTSNEGGGFTVRTILNRDADRSGIYAGIQWLHRNVRPADVAYVFFSGHGAVKNGRGYLLPSNGRLEDPGAEGIRFDEFRQEIVSTVDARAIVFFIDACHAAAMGVEGGRAKGEADVATALTAEWNRYFSQPGQTDDPRSIAFWATGSGQLAYEDSIHLRHGVFTHFLLEGLRGAAETRTAGAYGDGWIRVGELAQYVTRRVGDYSRDTLHNPQDPRISADADFEFPLAEAPLSLRPLAAAPLLPRPLAATPLSPRPRPSESHPAPPANPPTVSGNSLPNLLPRDTLRIGPSLGERGASTGVSQNDSTARMNEIAQGIHVNRQASTSLRALVTEFGGVHMDQTPADVRRTLGAPTSSSEFDSYDDSAYTINYFNNALGVTVNYSTRRVFHVAVDDPGRLSSVLRRRGISSPLLNLNGSSLSQLLGILGPDGHEGEPGREDHKFYILVAPNKIANIWVRCSQSQGNRCVIEEIMWERDWPLDVVQRAQAVAQAVLKIEEYGHLVAQSPGNAAYQYNLGLALSVVGDTVAAAAAFRRASEIAPNMAEAGVALRRAEATLAAARDSVSRLRTKLLGRPGDFGIYQALVDLLHEKLFLSTEAVDIHRQWLANHPNDHYARVNITEAYLTANQLSQADSALTAALADTHTTPDERVPLTVLAIITEYARQQPERVPALLATLRRDVNSRANAYYSINWTFNGTIHYIRTQGRLDRVRPALIELIGAVNARTYAESVRKLDLAATALLTNAR